MPVVIVPKEANKKKKKKREKKRKEEKRERREERRIVVKDKYWSTERKMERFLSGIEILTVSKDFKREINGKVE